MSLDLTCRSDGAEPREEMLAVVSETWWGALRSKVDPAARGAVDAVVAAVFVAEVVAVVVGVVVGLVGHAGQAGARRVNF